MLTSSVSIPASGSASISERPKPVDHTTDSPTTATPMASEFCGGSEPTSSVVHRAPSAHVPAQPALQHAGSPPVLPLDSPAVVVTPLGSVLAVVPDVPGSIDVASPLPVVGSTVELDEPSASDVVVDAGESVSLVAGTHVPANPSGARSPYCCPESQSSEGKLQKPVAGWQMPAWPFCSHWESSWQENVELHPASVEPTASPSATATPRTRTEYYGKTAQPPHTPSRHRFRSPLLARAYPVPERGT